MTYQEIINRLGLLYDLKYAKDKRHILNIALNRGFKDAKQALIELLIALEDGELPRSDTILDRLILKRLLREMEFMEEE